MTDSNNGVSLMQSGDYDGGSFSGDATTRLMKGGIVTPVNTDLIPNYANIFEGLKDQTHNSMDGQSYGVPHGRGPNLLAYNSDVVTEPQTSWDMVWGGGADGSGKVSVYDSSIYIADAALRLMKTNPELGVTNPYQLNEAQFTAAVDLLEQQRDAGALYWGTYSDQMASYAAGDVTTGTSWAFQIGLMQGEPDKLPIVGVLPDEGSTGWSDTWMIAAKAKNPNCAYKWLDHMASAEANSQATVWFGEASTSPQACEAAEALSRRPLRGHARERRALLGERLVLDDAAGRLRRHGQCHLVQGPGRLGRGVEHAPRPVGHGSLIGFEGSPGLAREPASRSDDPRRRTCRMSDSRSRAAGRRRRRDPASGDAWRRGCIHGAGVQIGLLLAPPVGWLAIAYFGALFILLLNAFWAKDAFTGTVEPFAWSLDAFQRARRATMSIGRSRSGPSAWRRWSPSPTRCLPSRSPTTWHGSPRRGRATCWSWRSCCRSGPPISSRSTRGGSILQGNGFLEWILAPFGLTSGRASTSSSNSGSSSATCGCPT